MSRDTVSRCLETSLHFWGCPTSRLVMVAPSSLVSRPGPAGGLRPALTPAAGGTFGPGSGCRAGCGCGLFGWAGWQPAGLVVPAGVQDQFAHQLTGVAVDDADVQVVDEQADRVPASRAPRPMWCSRLLWRTVTLPPLSILSCRTR